MAKTTVNNIVVEIKHAVDYDFSNQDSDFTTLVIEKINKNLKLINQYLFDYNVLAEITDSKTYQTIEAQAYRDVNKAVITGDKTTFTGQANDKIKVSVDGNDYDDIDVSGSTTITLVAAAINSAVGSTVATVTTTGYLQITSPTTGSSSSVTIADGTNTGQTVIAELFSDSDFRTDTAIYDLGDIIQLSERENETTVEMIPFDLFRKMYVDPSSSTTTTPQQGARLKDRIYLGPTPSKAILYHLEYFRVITEVAAGDTLPFTVRYDPLLVAMCKEDIRGFLRKDALVEARLNREEIKMLKEELIFGATHNVGMNRQSMSRKSGVPIHAPRKVV